MLLSLHILFKQLLASLLFQAMSGFDVKPLWKVHRVPLPLIDMTRPKNLRPLNLKLKEGSSTVPDENTLSNSTISSPCITPTSFTSLEPADTEVDVTGEKFYDIENSPLPSPSPNTSTSSKKKKLTGTTKKRCPCGKSDLNSTYITCSLCKQNWHNRCCNCYDLDQATIRKMGRWECPACYVCPSLGKLPASIYAEIHSMKDTLSALTMRDSTSSSCMLQEISQLKEAVKQTNGTGLSEKIETLQQQINELMTSPHGHSSVKEISPAMKAALESATTVLPESVASIQASLNSLNEQMSSLQSSFKQQNPHCHTPISMKPNTVSPHTTVTETPCKPYESYETHVVSQELKTELLEFIQGVSSEFVSADSDNSRELLYFGDYSYRYPGKELPAKKPPQILMKLLDTVDPKTDENRTLQANSCLVTRYSSGGSHIPMHRDDEAVIDPESHILTVSLGASRTMTFTNNDESQVETLCLEDCSLLVTSRFAQDFWKHGILPEHEDMPSERISFTFRHIAPQFINSTILLGDSNTAKVSFGTGQGTLGAWVPGKRVKVGHIEALPDAKDIGPYRNIVIHTGINSLTSRHQQRSDAFLIHTLEKKCIDYMRVYPRSKIHLSMLLPTRMRYLNDRVDGFNRAIIDMSYKHKNIRIIDNSIFGRNLSDAHGRWDVQDQRPLVSDCFHLGRNGIRIFAMNIKGAVIGKGVSQSRARFNSSHGSYRAAFGRARHQSAPVSVR